LVEILKICHTRKREIDQVEMLDAKVTLANIVDRILDTYNNNEKWVVKKMRS
jgi:hypothetical protein